MEEIKIALHLKEALDNLRPIDAVQENRIMQKFRLDWNYHSNHLEGNSLNYGETKALILFGVTAQGKPLKDHFEITGHNEAINWVIDMVKGARPLTENFIRELHKLLLKEPYEVDAVTPDGKPTKRRIAIGQYKTTPNHVKTKTGEIFYFASPEETPSKMYDLLEWFTDKTKEKEVNPIFLAAEFHYRFIRIHPFDDGNGRTARILMNFILMQYGFPPVIIKTEDKANYFAALQLADAGNIEAFITYIAQNLVHSLELMIAGAKGEDIEEPDDLDKEIALLENRLEKYSEVDFSVKQYNIGLRLNRIFYFGNFFDLFFNLYSKFDKFYLENTFSVIVSKNGNLLHFYDKIINSKTGKVEVKDFLRLIVFDKNKNIDYIEIMYQYNFFKKIEWQQFSFESKIKICFDDIGNPFIYLNENLETDKESEIDKIIKSEVKRHKEFIEQKIAEKESK